MARDYYIDPQIHATDLGEGRARLQVEGFPRHARQHPGVRCPAAGFVPGIVIQHSAEIDLVDLTIHHAGAHGHHWRRARATFSSGRVKVTPSGHADDQHDSGRDPLRQLLRQNFAHRLSLREHDGRRDQRSRRLRPDQPQALAQFSRGASWPILSRPDSIFSGAAKRSSWSTAPDPRHARVAHASPTVEQPQLLPRRGLRFLPPSTRKYSRGRSHLLAVADDQAEVLIERCIVRNNRARGILLGSRRRIDYSGQYLSHAGVAHSP